MEVADKAKSILAAHPALTLATAGGAYSPWVANVYFADESLDLFTFLETSGKTFTNVSQNPRVSLLVSDNDAQKDFLQGTGTATVLSPEQEPCARALLEKKIPFFKTYTPVVPVRIEVNELFVSSFASGWFPAKRLVLR